MIRTPDLRTDLRASVQRTSLVAIGASLVGAFLAAPPAPVSAQDEAERFPGVRLGLVYEAGSGRQGLAVKPFSGRFGGDAIASQVEAIIGRDLRYSDRFAEVFGVQT